MKLFCIVIAVITLNTQQHAQTYFRVQHEQLFNLVDADKESYNPKLKTKETLFESNFALTFPFTFITSETIAVSIRPGFVIGSNYSGYDIGILQQYFIDSVKYVMGGLNFHYNIGSSSISVFNSDNTLIPYLILGGGYKVLKNFFVEFQVNFPTNKDSYSNEFLLIEDSQESVLYFYRPSWLFKLCLAYQMKL